MKVACLLALHLPVQVERISDPSLAASPLVVGGQPWDPGAVVDCCSQAAATGVVPGMRLARAEKLCPDAHFAAAHDSEYRAAHQALVAAARGVTDRVETTGLGLLYLDAGGLGRRFSSDAQLVDELVQEAERISGLSIQSGLGEGKFVAEQAARAACPGRGCAVPPGQGRAFLSALSLTALPAALCGAVPYGVARSGMDLEMTRRLYLLGIRTMGELATLPRLAVVRQFGPEAGPLHDLSRGIDSRPVRPDGPPLALERRRTFGDALSERAPLLAHTGEMAAELAKMLAVQGLQAERLRLGLEEEDGDEHAAGGLVKPPSADAEKLTRLTGRLLEQMAPVVPVEAISLVAYPLRPFHLGAVQLGFLRGSLDLSLHAVQHTDRRGRPRHERLGEALRRLRERFGDMVVMIASLVGPPLPRSVLVTTDQGGMPCALVWQDRIREVMLIYETWRTRANWWRLPVERDYFRLETSDGRIRVVFHDLGADRWLLERRHI